MKASPLGILMAALIAAAAFVARRHGSATAPVDWSNAARVEIRMIEYEIVPSELRLRRGLPYRLHLVNAGKEGHDFTAPDFFAAVEVRNTGTLSESGSSVFLQPGQETDIYFIARHGGLFAPRCADHDWAGMTATIVID
jgi:uncharacterized cupredoxin-like copper-binding protein